MTLRVSKGPDLVVLPDVTGQTLDQARATLQAAGLQVGGLIGNSAGTVVQMIVGGEQRRGRRASTSHTRRSTSP